MNGDNGITSKTLKEFYDAPEAPPGFVYYIAGEPVMQIHFFEKFYTLFWLGSTNLTLFIDSFSHLVHDVSRGSTFTGLAFVRPLLFEGSVSVMVDRLQASISPPGGVPQPRYKKELLKIKPSDTLSFDRLSDHLKRFVRPFLPITVSIQSDVTTTMGNRDYEISLWADTERTKKTEKETGITSNLPLTNRVTELIEQTCPAARSMARADFYDFMGELRSQIADRRFY